MSTKGLKKKRKAGKKSAAFKFTKGKNVIKKAQEEAALAYGLINSRSDDDTKEKSAGEKNASKSGSRVKVNGSKKTAKTSKEKNNVVKSSHVSDKSAGKANTQSKKEKVKGIIKINAKGFAFVTPVADDGTLSKDDDIFIPADSVGSALSGDTVIVTIKKAGRLLRASGGKTQMNREGYVSEISARGDHRMTGFAYYVKKKGYFVKPDMLRTGGEIRLVGDTKDLKDGDIVVFELTALPVSSGYRDGMLYGAGELIEIVGNKDDKGADITAIVEKCGIRSEFPDDVIKQLDSIPDAIPDDEIGRELAGGRRDLRNLRIVTIDSEDTKDVDDGVSVGKLPNGNYSLGVHIADVTNYVTEGSPLDKEAAERGNSVYLPDRVIPMLPKKLSNGICSLNVGVPRFALSVMMEIDGEGNIVSNEVVKSLINVEYKITYEQLYAIMENHDETLGKEFEKYIDDFRLMREIAAVLKSKREKHGSIDFYFPETKVILDESGKCVDIKEYHITFANNIIEEFMLAANETVAKKYCEMEIPFMYRVHERPNEEKEGELLAVLGGIGVNAGRDAKGHMRPSDYRALLLNVKGSQWEYVVNTLALRSMQKACYSDTNKGHFGLAFDFYTHFTSPIRRYSDLFIHRMIKKTIDAGSPEKAFSETESKYRRLAESQSDICSRCERMADDAEREAVDLKISEYMSQFLGQTFTGKVSGVTNFGIFVRLENSAEGLIRYESFKNDYFKYFENRMMAVGQRTGRKIMLGMQMDVIVAGCDPSLRKIDFVPADE